MTNDAWRDHFSGPAEMVDATSVARSHYFGHRSKTDIAVELGMSRFKVARLLDLARTSGVVRITVADAGTLDLELSESLREELNLRYAVVVNTTRGSEWETREQLGAVAAKMLGEISTPEDVVGIGWARVVLAMAAHLSELRAHRVVQLTGALTRPDVEPSSIEVVRDVALLAGARSSVFFAPMVVSDELTARSLYRQHQIADAVAHFGQVTKAVVGVGGWDPLAQPCMTPCPTSIGTTFAPQVSTPTCPGCCSTRTARPSRRPSTTASSASPRPSCARFRTS